MLGFLLCSTVITLSRPRSQMDCFPCSLLSDSTGLRRNQAQYTEWRTMYYFAVGMQVVVLVGCYMMIPDYVAKNRDDLVYWKLLRSIMKFAVREHC
ncbi:hypothetical protein DFS33DRAFT_1311236 [Desarmillaria ectypa]|nr:hypothetical protein DFS33DRAFT_1311236 [Desarmillaria ectypa]